jgi:hypothetical protein
MSRLPAASQNDKAARAAGSFREQVWRLHCLAHRSPGELWMALAVQARDANGLTARTDAGPARREIALGRHGGGSGIFLAQGYVDGGGLLGEPGSSRIRKPSTSHRQLGAATSPLAWGRFRCSAPMTRASQSSLTASRRAAWRRVDCVVAQEFVSTAMSVTLPASLGLLLIDYYP